MAKFSDESQGLKFYEPRGKCQRMFFNFCQIGDVDSEGFQFPGPFMGRFLKEACTSRPADFHVVASEERFHHGQCACPRSQLQSQGRFQNSLMTEERLLSTVPSPVSKLQSIDPKVWIVGTAHQGGLYAAANFHKGGDKTVSQ